MPSKFLKIHPLSDVQTKNIGDNTVIWQFSVILENAEIGRNCNINCHTFIENDVIIRDNVTIKSGVYLWDGIRIEDDAFIGPNVTFVNDKYPKSKRYPPDFLKTYIGRGASIGANATIMGGLKIGQFALIGAGSVVIKNVLPNQIVAGNPAKVIGYINEDGEKLIRVNDTTYLDKTGNKFEVLNEVIQKVKIRKI
jgi:acetyltransferase-like isoleucine patch superfamily enzyme